MDRCLNVKKISLVAYGIVETDETVYVGKCIRSNMSAQKVILHCP